MTTTVLRNGAIFTATAATAWSTALVIRDGRVAAVGGDADLRDWLRHADDVVDLDGRLVTPGFIDAHVHPVVGGLERIRCDLSGSADAADYRRTIAAYAAGCSDAWVLGAGWAMAAFPDGIPHRRDLDAIVADRPVYLPNRDHHSAWVNTRALELAGIDAATPDPADGRIERDADGRPTGLLHEGAMDLVAALVPADTAADRLAGLRGAQTYLHSLGITAWQDAMVHHDGTASVHDTYLAAQAAGWLRSRVAGALWWDRAADDIHDTVAALVRLRADAVQAAAAAPAARYTLPHVKVMQDGVVETLTAALLEPYHDRCGHTGDNRGLTFLDPHRLADVVTALDAAGFGVHFHALGDRAVRDVLDALAAARAANGSSDRRHHLAHLQVVDARDRPRLRQLGAAANLQALWACHEPQMDELTIPVLGAARAADQYPFGDLHRLGTTLVMGSDWPVSTPDPWAAIHTAVNRTDGQAPPGTPALGGHQAIPLAAALTAYTAGSAWVTGADHEAGSLTPGRVADIAVHDRNPFDAAPSEIARTRVHRTYIAGDLVHHAD
ncbi:putative amidohydrolase YtcJ [Allocatelliglobosispora scoriae]|uniref:Putative amidohydrolase YtcJ n=1 Tax=Allocatelliglobosispora scoriae TaxID=643052 RepID=A0A841BK62_9ACTN|nr:amidohydrolase [Allocatelliglobosispora scoriae]MBB5867393.1 putative amidohydrolase YtcJ [Allocatelliglobosispora scoriae]